MYHHTPVLERLINAGANVNMQLPVRELEQACAHIFSSVTMYPSIEGNSIRTLLSVYLLCMCSSNVAFCMCLYLY